MVLLYESNDDKLKCEAEYVFAEWVNLPDSNTGHHWGRNSAVEGGPVSFHSIAAAWCVISRGAQVLGTYSLSSP